MVSIPGVAFSRVASSCVSRFARSSPAAHCKAACGCLPAAAARPPRARVPEFPPAPAAACNHMSCPETAVVSRQSRLGASYPAPAACGCLAAPAFACASLSVARHATPAGSRCASRTIAKPALAYRAGQRYTRPRAEGKAPVRPTGRHVTGRRARGEPFARLAPAQDTPGGASKDARRTTPGSRLASSSPRLAALHTQLSLIGQLARARQCKRKCPGCK